MKRFYRMPYLIIGMVLTLWLIAPAWAQDKPNIVIIWGDDIGQSNVSAYTKGLMGYQTPNIDRKRRDDLYRLLCRAELHGWPFGLYHRPERVPHRPE
jgi:hypothetical protein